MAKLYSFGQSGELTTFVLDGTRLMILQERNGDKPECVFDEYFDPEGYLQLLTYMSEEHDNELKEGSGDTNSSG